MRSIVGFGTSVMAAAVLSLFMGVYNSIDIPLVRTAVWLVYKLFCFLLMRLWCKFTCYAMQDDVHSLLLLFMMVVAFESHFSAPFPYLSLLWPTCSFF